MAFGHGKDTIVLLNGNDISAFFRSIGQPSSAEVADTSTFGTSSRTKIAGLKDGSLTGEGIYEPAMDAGLDNDLAADANGIVGFWPQGDTQGNTGRMGEGIETEYEITADLGDAVGFTVGYEANGGFDGVVSLLSYLTDVSATGDQTVLDQTAATSDGGRAYLHVTGASGGTTADVTIRHSSDNFSGDDTLLATFTQVSASGSAERVVIASGTTVKRYVRVAVTLGAGGTWNFNVALKRD